MSLEAKRLTLPILPRREEEALIRTALKEAREQGAVRVVFLGGLSGTGKSTLIKQALSCKDSTNQCWHASTKFDQRKPNAPLENLRSILSDLTDTAMRLDGSLCPAALKNTLDRRQYHVLKKFLNNTVDPGMLEAEDVDSSEEFKEAENSESSDSEDEKSVATQSAEVSKDALSVLTSTLKACIRSIAKLSTVILTLDDIHWSCGITMHVLKSLLLDPSLSNFLLCATFRTDELTCTEGFYEWKEQLEEDLASAAQQELQLQQSPASSSSAQLPSLPTTAQTILLDNLTKAQVTELLADALSKDVDQVQELADIVFGFTHGNLFFMKHFLEKLQDDELLTFDYGFFRWNWDVQAIKRRSSLSENVVQTVASRLYKLPQHVQNVLMLASCFGARFDIRALEASKSALGVDCVYHSVGEALKNDFVIQLNETHYRFSHDMIQLTAYGLLPEDVEVSQVHWRIGSLLMQHEELLKDDSTFFQTVDHLNLGGSDDDCMCECDHEKKCKMARLNLRAAKKASALSSFVPAVRYLEAGVACLGDKPFQCHYDLAVKLYSALASTEYIVGNIDEAMEASKQVLDNAKTCEELAPMMIVKFDCFVARGQITELLDFVFHKIDLLGLKLPRKPNPIYVQKEYQKMKRQLKQMSNEDILALPEMKDQDKEIILEMLYRINMPLYQKEQHLLCMLVASQMIQITLKYGLSKNCAQAFVYAAAFIAGDQSHDIREAYRLGELGLKMNEKFGATTTSLYVTGMIPSVAKWWLEPVTNSLELFVQTERAAFKRGIMGSAFQSTIAYLVNYFYAGLPLRPLLDDVEKHCNRYLEYNNVLYFFLATPLWQCLLNLTGRSENPASLEEGEVITRRNAFKNPHNSGNQTLQSYQMVLSFYLGDLPKATEMAEELHKVKAGIMKASFWYSSRRMFLGLVAIANYRLKQRRKDKAEADKQLKFFRTVVKEGAINLVHKLQLLEAEMMSLKKFSFASASKSQKDIDAIFAKYDESIVSASRAGYLQDAALANYLCFQFIITNRNDRMHMAELYLKRSFELYMSWGALAVASSLVERHPDFFNAESARSSISSSLKGSSVSGSTRNSGMRGRSRFDAQLSTQHKELNVM